MKRKAPSPDHARRPAEGAAGAVTPPLLSRRALLVGGLGLLLGACARPGATRYAWGPGHRPIRPTGGIYIVRSGDTLSAIARRAGLSVRGIVDANRLTTTTIVPGQRLFLPGVSVMGADPLAGRPAAGPAPDWPHGYLVVPRSRWTSARIGKNHRRMKRISRITVHHTGEHTGMAGLSDIEIVRRIDNYHRNGRKWAAIGYHYLIGRDGRIYQGRPESIQGAHTSGANKFNLGISVMGDFSRHLPTRAQLVALRNFLEDTRRRLGISKSRIYGHRDLARSSCPGDRLYSWLRSFKTS